MQSAKLQPTSETARVDQTHQRGLSDEKVVTRKAYQLDRSVSKSPRNQLMPLSQKFSAYPTTDFKARGLHGQSLMQKTIYSGY